MFAASAHFEIKVSNSKKVQCNLNKLQSWSLVHKSLELYSILV